MKAKNFVGILCFLFVLLYFSMSSPSWGQGFTAGMAKREAPGRFDAAPIVQGDPNNASSL